MTRPRSKRPDWYTADDVRAANAARYGTDPDAPTGPPSGILAQFDGFCWKCDRTIVQLESRVALRKGNWICVQCAGADE